MITKTYKQRAIIELALMRNASMSDIYLTDYPEYKGYQCYNDAGHGYLLVPLDDHFYPVALEINKASGYSYLLPCGTIALEEDCDKYAFLDRI